MLYYDSWSIPLLQVSEYSNECSVVQTDPQYLVSFFLCSLGLSYKGSDEIFIQTLYNPSLKISDDS
jgi:hypothetical protein